MVKHLFKNFLSNPYEYELAVKYWRELCDQILCVNRQQNQWKPWLNIHFADGTPFQDGNPIYNLISEGKCKGLCIIQEEPNTDDVEISAWMDTFGDYGNGEEDSIKELVIVCALSNESVKIASSLIKAWIAEDRTYPEMENLIRLIQPSPVEQNQKSEEWSKQQE